jgi:phosphoketolase
VFDNPELIALACVGDGEAETGPLATSWHINKFLNPISDGAVLPVLHLNGYKIANPTLLARIPREELASLLRGYGWDPLFVEGHEPMAMHQAMAAAMDTAMGRISAIRAEARRSGEAQRPCWPMIVLRSPKGWTGPAALGDKKLEGFWRAHQVPLPNPRHDTAQLQQLEAWLKSYRPWELFDDNGSLRPELQALSPVGQRRMGSNPHANGGLLRRKLHLPQSSAYAVAVSAPGQIEHENTAVLGELLAFVRRGDVEAVHSLRRGAAEALEAIVRGDHKTCKFAGRRIEEVGLPKGAQVGAIVRGLHRPDGSEAGDEAKPQVIIAHHDTVVMPNDHVIIFVPRKRMVREVEKLFQVSATFMF